jgi:hypothetical protein
LAALCTWIETALVLDVARMKASRSWKRWAVKPFRNCWIWFRTAWSRWASSEASCCEIAGARVFEAAAWVRPAWIRGAAWALKPVTAASESAEIALSVAVS